MLRPYEASGVARNSRAFNFNLYLGLRPQISLYAP